VNDRLEVLISAAQIAERIEELAAQIGRDYLGRDILVVSVLKGSFIFLADLVRKLPFSVEIDFLRVVSYGAATETAGVVQFRMDVDAPVTGRHVLIVEDILDTGLTLDYLKRHLQSGQPASLRTCTMLDKKGRRRVQFEADYVGFTIDDYFVVGYGLDFDEHHRNLPDVCILKQGQGERH
jgi:hypoxanthine phosphoribosyltransferase